MERRDSKRKKNKYNENDDFEDYSKSSRFKRRRSRSRTPKENRNENSRYKRKHSQSPIQREDTNHEKRSNEQLKEVETKKDAPIRKAKETDMLNTRTGGAYIPPARLRMMQAQITDKSSVAYQRLAWEALKKSIHGHINKINVGNIGIIIKELLKENIVRGRGLLCRSVIQAQAASPTFTNVYAALVSAVNSRFPNIGELLLKRLVIQFKRGFKRNDKPICISSALFIAHLVNQKVAHEILALELLTLLVETPTDDSVEVAIAFLKECGQKLTEVSSKGVNAIFEMLRNILHEGQLDKRVQYMIEVMFQVWKDGFKDHPAVIEELELVPEEEQFTHLLMLDDATDSQDILNVFKFDDKYEENEQKYKTLSKEILGSEAESGEEDGSEGSGSDESDDEDEDDEKKEMTIIDKTETNLVALRRTIYLTINSSLDFEECAHKLMKMQLKPGQEIELCHMFLDCCAEQRTYEKFYGLLAQRFCNINRIYIGPFEEIFKDSYATAHRLDTNRLRNVSKFFAHLLFTDSISWEVLECVKLNEEDTTSSSRIYIKILFQELAEYMGLKKLNDRLKDPTLQQAFSGVFPRDNPKNTRFSINFFTSIGLGGLTDELREHLKQMPKNVPPPVTEINIDSESSSDSSSSSSSNSSSSDSSSDASDNEENSKKKSKSKKAKKDTTKEPQTPERGQASPTNMSPKRWGHDGFYDTYGQGARRAEPNRSERNQRSIDRDYEKNRGLNKYQNANEQIRQNRGRRDGSREGEFREKHNKRDDNSRRGRDNEMKRKKNNDDEKGKREENEVRRRRDNDEERGRRRDNNEERGQRRDNNDERGQRRDNNDERGPRRDEDEARHRKDNNRDTRKTGEDENKNRRGKELDEATQRKRYYENDRRDERRKGDENDTHRLKVGEIRQGNENSEESTQKRTGKDVIKRRDYYEKEEKGRRDDSETQRQKDYDNEIKRRKDILRELERQKDDDRKSKDGKYDRRHRKNSRDETEENVRRRDEEVDIRSKKDELYENQRRSSYDGDKVRKKNNREKRDKDYDRKHISDECEKAKNKINNEDEKINNSKKKSKNKREERVNKTKKEKRSSKKKGRKKSETSSDSSSSSASDSDSDSATDSSNSDSESDTGISKPSRRDKIPRKKSNKQSDSDEEKNNRGGRYWDRFDIDIRDRKSSKN